MVAVISPLASSSNHSYCHSPSPVDHLTSFHVTLAWPETYWFTEIPNWRKCTGVGDLVRGKTRSGIRFYFSLNHRQGKSELSLIQGPPSTVSSFPVKKKAELGDISGFHSHVFRQRTIHSCLGNDQRKPAHKQHCHMTRTRRKIGEEVFSCPGAASPCLEGICRRMNNRNMYLSFIHLFILQSTAIFWACWALRARGKDN